MSLLLLLGLLLSTLVLADFTPTAPGPGQTFAAGSPCTIKWNADNTGQWTNVSIYFMTGSNTNMTRLATVASGLDGTDSTLSPYNWTCPEVHPYSAIYFYQFNNGGDQQNARWTTRFTITSPSGHSERPEHHKQPNGDSVPWGEGRLRLVAAGDRSSIRGHSNAALSDGSSQRDVGDSDPDDNSTDKSNGGQEDGGDGSSNGRNSQDGIGDHTEGHFPTQPSPDSTSTPSRHPPNGSDSDASDVSIPTVSLPRKARPASTRSGSSLVNPPPSARSSQMGPGVSNAINDVKIASGDCAKHDRRWQGTAAIYWFLAAMLL